MVRIARLLASKSRPLEISELRDLGVRASHVVAGVVYYELDFSACGVALLRDLPAHGANPREGSGEANHVFKETGASSSGAGVGEGTESAGGRFSRASDISSSTAATAPAQGPEDVAAKRWTCMSLRASTNRIRRIENLEPVARNLRRLDLSVNQLTELGQLATGGLDYLMELDLSSNGLESLSGLSSLPRLRKLNVSFNRLETLEGLGEVHSLRSLSCSGNKLERLDGILGLVRLKSLEAYRNKLRSMDQVVVFEELTSLDLAGNELDDVDGCQRAVVALTNLTELRLQGNPIEKHERYRLSLIQNKAILLLDGTRVTAMLRRRLEEARNKKDMDGIIKDTTTEYMDLIHYQKTRKNASIDILKQREEMYEHSFELYRNKMEAELDECISYIRSLDFESTEFRWLATEEGLGAWRELLRAAEATRLAHGREAVRYMEELRDEADPAVRASNALGRMRSFMIQRAMKRKHDEVRQREERREQRRRAGFDSDGDSYDSGSSYRRGGTSTDSGSTTTKRERRTAKERAEEAEEDEADHLRREALQRLFELSLSDPEKWRELKVHELATDVADMSSVAPLKPTRPKSPPHRVDEVEDVAPVPEPALPAKPATTGAVALSEGKKSGTTDDGAEEQKGGDDGEDEAKEAADYVSPLPDISASKSRRGVLGMLTVIRGKLARGGERQHLVKDFGVDGKALLERKPTALAGGVSRTPAAMKADHTAAVKEALERAKRDAAAAAAAAERDE